MPPAERERIECHRCHTVLWLPVMFLVRIKNCDYLEPSYWARCCTCGTMRQLQLDADIIGGTGQMSVPPAPKDGA